MREMKDSGVDWIGRIPVNWTRSKIKNICAMIGSGTTPDSHIIDYYDGTVNWIQSGDIYGKAEVLETSTNITNLALRAFSALKIYKAPFIIMAMYGGSVGNIAISKIDACTNQACCCMKPNLDVNFRFLYYWLIYCKQDFLVKAEGGGQPNISQNKIKNQSIFFPSKTEQQSIVAYLDTKCAEIDALSADIQSEIDTLEAYKRSVITEAVTKGLDKNMQMKDSKMEWVGNIPSHWRVEKTKYHLQRYELRNPGEQQILSVYREYGVIPKDSRDDNHNVTSEDTSKYKYVKPGYLVINKMKAWQGSMGISEYEGVVSPAYFIYRFMDALLNPKYLHYLFRSCYKDEFRRISGGIREGQWDLSPEAFGNTLLLIPPLEEQNFIVQYIDSITSEIESVIAQKQKQLEVLADYKKSIIYEYVTGKKEVPTA